MEGTSQGTLKDMNWRNKAVIANNLYRGWKTCRQPSSPL